MKTINYINEITKNTLYLFYAAICFQTILNYIVMYVSKHYQKVV